MESNQHNQQLAILKLKYLFKKLEGANIVGGAVTMAIPPKKQIFQIISALNAEMSQAANIKSKQHRNSVIQSQSAIKQKLKYYKRIPENGLIIFSGYVLQEHQKTQKRLLQIIEPYRPINLSLYYCDKYFRVQELKRQLLIVEPPFGYIVLDGQGVLFAVLRGTSIQIIYQNSVTLPNRHNRGGQSKLRFQRHANQARRVYLSKVSESATKYFLQGNKCNMQGIILAGCAGLKNQLQKSALLDPRIEGKICSVTDISRGGPQGLYEAIQFTRGTIKNSKLCKDKQILNSFFENIIKDTGMVVYGIKDTISMLENGMISHLIVNENLQIRRVEVVNRNGERQILYLKNNEQLLIKKGYQIQSDELFAEWLISNYYQYSCQISFVGDELPEGTQFSNGFSGFGGYLRHRIEMKHFMDQQETCFVESQKDI